VDTELRSFEKTRRPFRGDVDAVGQCGRRLRGCVLRNNPHIASLSCAGYPKNVTVFTNSGISSFVQVCKIVPLTAPLTPRVWRQGSEILSSKLETGLRSDYSLVPNDLPNGRRLIPSLKCDDFCHCCRVSSERTLICFFLKARHETDSSKGDLSTLGAHVTTSTRVNYGRSRARAVDLHLLAFDRIEIARRWMLMTPPVFSHEVPKREPSDKQHAEASSEDGPSSKSLSSRRSVEFHSSMRRVCSHGGH
jgi:hypothetical protein